MTWEYPFFTEKEMRCKCGNCAGLPKRSFMERLVALRRIYDKPMIVTSGYRCPEYNMQVSTSGREGPHTLGLAADIAVWGENALKLVELAPKYGFTGVGVKQRGEFKGRFVHIDTIEPGGKYPRPFIWSY